MNNAVNKFVCPMHPEVTSDKPGKCTICGMDLVEKGKESPKKSFLETYKPLFIIIGLIFVASVVSGSGWRGVMQSFMAGFFLVFSGFKFLDLPGFAQGYSTYDLLARKVFAYGYIYPFIELALGLAYLTGYEPVATNWVTVVVMLFSGAGVVISLMQKREFQCACLGTVIKVPLLWCALIKSFISIGSKLPNW